MTRPVIDLKSLLKADEGFSYPAQKDAHGSYTIGYGYNVNFGPRLSDTIYEQILDYEIEFYSRQTWQNLPWTRYLDEVRQAVFISMCSEMGIGGLLSFDKMLAAGAANDWADCAEQLADSDYYRDPGTHDRAERLRQMILTAKWV